MFGRVLLLVLLAFAALSTATVAHEGVLSDTYEATDHLQVDKPGETESIGSEPAATARIEEIDAELRSIITRLSVGFKEEIAQIAQSEATHRHHLDGLSGSLIDLEEQVNALRSQLEDRATADDIAAYASEIDSLKTQVAKQQKAIQRLYILCVVAAIAGLLIK